jgi:hypothetical protein
MPLEVFQNASHAHVAQTVGTVRRIVYNDAAKGL